MNFLLRGPARRESPVRLEREDKSLLSISPSLRALHPYCTIYRTPLVLIFSSYHHDACIPFDSGPHFQILATPSHPFSNLSNRMIHAKRPLALIFNVSLGVDRVEVDLLPRIVAHGVCQHGPEEREGQGKPWDQILVSISSHVHASQIYLATCIFMFIKWCRCKQSSGVLPSCCRHHSV